LIAYNAVDNSQSDISLLSVAQILHTGNKIDPIASIYGGKQCIYDPTTDTTIPMFVRRGLVAMPHRPPTPEEMKSLPRVILTGDVHWSPKDHTYEQLSSTPFASMDDLTYTITANPSSCNGLLGLGGG
jgi:hypothetical protein